MPFAWRERLSAWGRRRRELSPFSGGELGAVVAVAEGAREVGVHGVLGSCAFVEVGFGWLSGEGGEEPSEESLSPEQGLVAVSDADEPLRGEAVPRFHTDAERSRVHARIGAAARLDVWLRAEHVFERLLKDALYASGIFLHLPA